MYIYISDRYLRDETATIWLQNREPLMARMARNVLENLDSAGNYWQDDYNILLDQDLPLYENGSWWLALSLASKHDELRRLALDALIAAVEENRADAKKVGQTMASLQKIPTIKWAKGLRELARISALHALFCWQLLVSYTSDKKQETALGFLELLLELKEEHGFGLSADASTALGQFQGTGKAAKIAKALAATGENWTGFNSLQLAAKESLHSRITRVERWQQSEYFSPSHGR